jgi:hypothetical protein
VLPIRALHGPLKQSYKDSAAAFLHFSSGLQNAMKAQSVAIQIR